MNYPEVYDDIAETLRTALGRNKIKYSVLDELLELPRIDTIHINLDSIFSFITAKYLVKSEEIDASYRYVIASSILNIVGHYRHFCVRRGWIPTIYLYVTNKWSETVEASLKLIEIISYYIDKVYFMKVTKHDAPYIYMNYFIREKKNFNNLILTKDMLDLQLLGEYTHVIHLNKDNSIYYSPKNLWYNMSEGTVEHSVMTHEFIGPVLFYSGTGTKNSGVKNMGKKKTVKLFDKLVSRGQLTNSRYFSYEDIVYDAGDFLDDDLTKFKENFTKYDLFTRYNKVMTTSKSRILDSYIIDKFSRKDLYELNNKYFTGFDSLQLEYLMEVPADPKAGGRKLKW